MKKISIILGAGLLILAAIIFLSWKSKEDTKLPPAEVGQRPVAAKVESPFLYAFSKNLTLYEAGEEAESADPYWWVNSGALLFMQDGVGNTMQGSLPSDSTWRKKYNADNATDTDNGLHPQNIFRLIFRSLWQNFQQEAYFRINNDNLSKSSNRNESNGLFLFSRYQDSDDLYYAGVRVDGTAAIKKKVRGIYYILDQKPLFPGTYNQQDKKSLLPKDTWIGLRTITYNASISTVIIKLYVDIGKTGQWKLAAEARDDGSKYGSIIDGKHSAGIRTDYMDVSFDDYRIEELYNN